MGVGVSVGGVWGLRVLVVERRGALCPYCMVVWVVMIVIFSYLTLANLERGHLPAPRRLVEPLLRVHSTIPLL